MANEEAVLVTAPRKILDLCCELSAICADEENPEVGYAVRNLLWYAVAKGRVELDDPKMSVVYEAAAVWEGWRVRQQEHDWPGPREKGRDLLHDLCAAIRGLHQ